MVMDVNLTNRELFIIKTWAESTISGGHWGNGDVLFPDEANALSKININTDSKANIIINFNQIDIKTILIWADTSTDSPEEVLLKEKLNKLKDRTD